MAKAITLFMALAISCFGASSSVHVEGIRFASYADHTLVYIVSDTTVHYRTGRLSDPIRIYFDILNAKIGRKLTVRKLEVADQLLQYVRVGCPGRRRTRVVLDLNTAVSERIIRLMNPPGLLVNIEKPTSAAINLIGPTQARLLLNRASALQDLHPAHYCLHDVWLKAAIPNITISYILNMPYDPASVGTNWSKLATKPYCRSLRLLYPNKIFSGLSQQKCGLIRVSLGLPDFSTRQTAAVRPTPLHPWRGGAKFVSGQCAFGLFEISDQGRAQSPTAVSGPFGREWFLRSDLTASSFRGLLADLVWMLTTNELSNPSYDLRSGRSHRVRPFPAETSLRQDFETPFYARSWTEREAVVLRYGPGPAGIRSGPPCRQAWLLAERRSGISAIPRYSPFRSA